MAVDGSTHTPAAEAVRTALLESAGFQVVRLGNTEGLEDLDGALRRRADLMGLYEVFMTRVPIRPSPPAVPGSPAAEGHNVTATRVRGTPRTGTSTDRHHRGGTP